jgi:hypothetical protein
MEWQKELKDPQEFLESVKVDLFQDEVYVFTPKGDVRSSPAARPRSTSPTPSTRDVGTHCAGARVNGAIVPAAHAAPLGRRGRDPHRDRPAAPQGLARPRRSPPARAPRSARTSAPSSASARCGSAASCSSASSTRRALVRRLHHARARHHDPPARLHQGPRHRSRAPRRDPVGLEGQDQPHRAAQGRHAEPRRHPRYGGLHVQRPGHQHHRGELPRGDDGRAVNIFTFMCQDLNQLKNVMRALQKVAGVVGVERA